MGPSRRGNDGATTSLAPLLLLSSVFICSESIQLPKYTIYNTTVDGKQFTTFYFTDFNKLRQQPGILVFSSNSTITQGALQITPDTTNDAASFLVNQAGRVFFPSPFALWAYKASSNSPDGKHIVSFNSSFMFNLFRLNQSIKGEGLTFLIASGNDEPPPGSYGGYLGLTNASTDGRATNGFVAVELDTVKQSYDPDDNHVGLNVNGVRSTYATPLAPHGIQLAPTNTSSGTYNAWVEYDGTTRHISVYISAHESKPATAVLNAPVDLSRILLGRKAYFGFSASTGVHYQLNCVLQWMMMVEMLDDNHNGNGAKNWKARVITGVSCGALMVTLGLLAALLYLKKKKDREGTISLFDNTIGLMAIPGLPKVFDYKELSKGTKDFDEKMKLGQGGYGVVYRATVPMKDGDTMEVAVKQFSGANTKGQEDFLAELSIINRLRHRNLVKLVGWCHHNGVLMLVYDYMPNGSLDKHIFGGKQDAPALNWEQRYNVVAGIASALNYLHHEYDQMVVHRDIKPSNIMLDSSFNARLGDFGLARALDSGKSSYTDIIGVPGTLGYIAPECFHTGRATRESDVFAFGAVVLEVVCGRRNISCNSPGGFGQLLEWVWRLHGDQGRRVLDAVDPRLGGEFDEEDAERLLLLGLACSHPNAGERPRTKAIMQNLTRSVPPFAVPLARPAFTWPVEPVVNVSEDTDGTTQMSQPTLTATMVVEVDQEQVAGGQGAQHVGREGCVVHEARSEQCAGGLRRPQQDAPIAHLDMDRIKPRLSGVTSYACSRGERR